MNADPAPVVNKLILAVLFAILGCLVLLVLRAYRAAPSPHPQPVHVAEVTDAAPAEESPAPAATASPSTPLQGARQSAPRVTQVRSGPRGRAPAPAVSVAPVLEVAPPPAGSTTPDVRFVPVAEPVPAPAPRAAATAQIQGTVTLVGTPPPEIRIELGPSCGRLNSNAPTTRHFVVGPNGELANVVVYVKAGVHGSFSSSDPTPVLDQTGCMFEPYVMAVMAGQPFQIRNSDPELHNVHATPRNNHGFNIGQSSRGAVTQKIFDHPELSVRIKCDVHPWMFAYISVLKHPFFAVTDTNGFFALPAGIPAGHYTLSALHLKAGEQTQELNIVPGEQKVVNFQFEADPAGGQQRRVARAER